jgi:hypothetical protein
MSGDAETETAHLAMLMRRMETGDAATMKPAHIHGAGVFTYDGQRTPEAESAWLVGAVHRAFPDGLKRYDVLVVGDVNPHWAVDAAAMGVDWPPRVEILNSIMKTESDRANKCIIVNHALVDEDVWKVLVAPMMQLAVACTFVVGDAFFV